MHSSVFFFRKKKTLACQSFTAALEGDRVRVGWVTPRRFANAVSWGRWFLRRWSCHCAFRRCAHALRAVASRLIGNDGLFPAFCTGTRCFPLGQHPSLPFLLGFFQERTSLGFHCPEWVRMASEVLAWFPGEWVVCLLVCLFCSVFSFKGLGTHRKCVGMASGATWWPGVGVDCWSPCLEFILPFQSLIKLLPRSSQKNYKNSTFFFFVFKFSEQRKQGQNKWYKRSLLTFLEVIVFASSEASLRILDLSPPFFMIPDHEIFSAIILIVDFWKVESLVLFFFF